MLIKLFLLLSLLIVPITLKPMIPDPAKLPSKEEILRTGHPLTIVLFAGIEEYRQNPVRPRVSVLFPCLQQHSLLRSPWIHEKGFSRDIAKAYDNNKPQEEVKRVIKDNRNYQAVPEMTQRLLMVALMQAFEDCKKAAQANK